MMEVHGHGWPSQVMRALGQVLVEDSGMVVLLRLMSPNVSLWDMLGSRNWGNRQPENLSSRSLCLGIHYGLSS